MNFGNLGLLDGYIIKFLCIHLTDQGRVTSMQRRTKSFVTNTYDEISAYLHRLPLHISSLTGIPIHSGSDVIDGFRSRKGALSL